MFSESLPWFYYRFMYCFSEPNCCLIRYYREHYLFLSSTLCAALFNHTVASTGVFNNPKTVRLTGIKGYIISSISSYLCHSLSVFFFSLVQVSSHKEFLVFKLVWSSVAHCLHILRWTEENLDSLSRIFYLLRWR